MELVEGLGVFVPAHNLVSAVRAAKNSASALIRQLMGIVFTQMEMATSSVKGRGNKPALDPQKMEAIMGKIITFGRAQGLCACSSFQASNIYIYLYSVIYTFHYFTLIGYVLSKFPNERTEYLVRQANDKCARCRARAQL